MRAPAMTWQKCQIFVPSPIAGRLIDDRAGMRPERQGGGRSVGDAEPGHHDVLGVVHAAVREDVPSLLLKRKL